MTRIAPDKSASFECLPSPAIGRVTLLPPRVLNTHRQKEHRTLKGANVEHAFRKRLQNSRGVVDKQGKT